MFRVRRGVVEVSLIPELRAQLSQAAGMVLSLVEPGGDDVFGAASAPDVPTDPALVRLFPSAYADDGAAAEFRRLTDGDLRSGKRSDAARLRETAGDPVLEPDTAECWLRAMNDARLIMGSRLGIQTDEDAERLAADTDPIAGSALLFFLHLGLLQEELIAALD